MQTTRIPFSEIPQLSNRDRTYANGAQNLRPFFKYPVELDAFEKVIADKANETIDRELLVSVLRKQQRDLPPAESVQINTDKLLATNTFTITTAHQPCLFTGPLYCIYKIISTIKLTAILAKRYPDFQFVPVFIVGGEDHDFEEINHTRVFGKALVWEKESSGGSVGAMETKSLATVLAELKQILGESSNAQQIYSLVEKAYTNSTTFGKATQLLFHELFKQYGLVVMDMGDADLKRAFIPVIKEEIMEQPSRALVEVEGEKLSALGFGQQATPRDINFFYLQPHKRQRIVFEDGAYQVLDSSLRFTKAELEEEITNHPERFSPNVVMRPIYQEMILPNLAYVGGGGELAYWMERTSQFAHFGVNFPMLIRRDSVLWIDQATSKRRDKLGLSIQDLFTDTEQLINEYVKKNAEVEIELTQEKNQVEQIFQQVADKAKTIDPSLYKKVLAEGAKAVNSIGQLEGRLRKAEKQNNETAVNQIRKLKDKLFPANGLQERKDNYLEFYVKYGDTFIDTLMNELNPLEKSFVVIEE